MQKKVWYYEKWVGCHASFPPRRSVNASWKGISNSIFRQKSKISIELVFSRKLGKDVWFDLNENKMLTVLFF